MSILLFRSTYLIVLVYFQPHIEKFRYCDAVKQKDVVSSIPSDTKKGKESFQL